VDIVSRTQKFEHARSEGRPIGGRPEIRTPRPPRSAGLAAPGADVTQVTDRTPVRRNAPRAARIPRGLSGSGAMRRDPARRVNAPRPGPFTRGPSASALTPSGSTHRWKTLRATYARLLPLPCWRCGAMIERDPPGTPFRTSGWVLGHVGLNRCEGAGDDHLAPEHRRCSDQSGGVLGAARLAAARKLAGPRATAAPGTGRRAGRKPIPRGRPAGITPPAEADRPRSWAAPGASRRW
jgi:hypothetical protein